MKYLESYSLSESITLAASSEGFKRNSALTASPVCPCFAEISTGLFTSSFIFELSVISESNRYLSLPQTLLQPMTSLGLLDNQGFYLAF